jgi:hypothetical protein
VGADRRLLAPFSAALDRSVVSVISRKARYNVALGAVMIEIRRYDWNFAAGFGFILTLNAFTKPSTQGDRHEGLEQAAGS